MKSKRLATFALKEVWIELNVNSLVTGVRVNSHGRETFRFLVAEVTPSNQSRYSGEDAFIALDCMRMVATRSPSSLVAVESYQTYSVCGL